MSQPYSPIVTSGGAYYGEPTRKSSRFTWQCPSSCWFYIGGLAMCLIVGVVATAAAGGLVLGIIQVGSNNQPALQYQQEYYYNNAAANSLVPQSGVSASSITPSPSPNAQSSGDTNSVTNAEYQDLEARVAGLEERIRNLSLQPGPPGPRGAPGTCTTDQCGTASTSQGSTSTLRVSGDAANLMPPTIAQGPVSVRVANGYVEVIEGGISTKGPITTQSMFASPSDQRVKFNITERNVSHSIQNILNLSPVQYNYHPWWVKHTGREYDHEIGFIAQQVESIFPFAVTREGVSIPGYGNISDFNMLNERAIIAELVGAVQYLYNQTLTCKCTA